MSQILYEMVIENITDLVYAISLVDKPAIEEEFILLSKDGENKFAIDIQLEKVTDEKRRVVTGCILTPDKVIPRKGYDIIFSKETVRKISENYLMNGYKDSVTLQHKMPVDKVKMIESWIVEDPKNDKSTALGMDLPVGSWCASFKILDNQLWSEYIESGVLKGFSLEGSFSQKEVKLEDEYDLDAEIIKVVDLIKKKVELEEERGITSAIGGIISKILSNKKKQEALDTYYVWRLGDADHCPACLSFDRQVKKLKEWLNIAIPRHKTGEYFKVPNTDLKFVFNSPHSKLDGTPAFGSYCESACQCDLVPLRNKNIKRSITGPNQQTKKSGVVYPPMPNKPQIIKKNPFKK